MLLAGAPTALENNRAWAHKFEGRLFRDQAITNRHIAVRQETSQDTHNIIPYNSKNPETTYQKANEKLNCDLFTNGIIQSNKNKWNAASGN